MGEDDELEPFREDVEARFYEWLEHQDRWHRFTSEQMGGSNSLRTPSW